MLRNRNTVAGIVAFGGLALHAGQPVRVEIHPGESGLVFCHGSERTEATPENVTDTKRCTRIGGISTVEHLLSACAALELTDADITLTFPELPALDGGALTYYEGIQAMGLAGLAVEEIPDLFKRVYFQEGDIKIAIAKGDGHWRYEYNNDEPWPGFQPFELTDFANYPSEVAPARTFCLESEVATMLQNGLGLGLDATTALIITEDGYRNEAKFPDEPARHKLLDLIGDLALAGVPVRGLSVVGERSGHRTNVAAAAKLRAMVFGTP